MNDIYLMNKETGELVPAHVVIKNFYKTHGYMDSWTDEWIETDIEVENSFIPVPDFANAIL